MFVALCFSCIFFLIFIFNKKVYKSYVNYSTGFAFLWCLAASLSAFGFYDFYIPSWKAYAYIAVVVIVFEATTSFWKKVRIGKRKPRIHVNVIIPWKALSALGIICFIYMIPIMAITISRIMAEGMNEVRIMMLYNKIISTSQSLILETIIQPIILVNTTLGLYELIINRKWRTCLFVSILDVVAYILIFSNRWIMMEIIYLIAIMLLHKYSFRIVQIIRDNKRIVFISLIFVAIIGFVTMQRQIRGSRGILYNVYAYFVGSIHLFGVSISNPNDFLLFSDSNMLNGTVLFSSFLGLINMFSLFFTGKDFSIRSGNGVLNEITQKYYYVSPSTHMNNNFTMVYGFLRDFGVAGLVIDTTVLGILYAYLYKNQKKSVIHECAYIFGISIFPSLIFEWMLGRTYILVCFIVFVAFYFFFKKRAE